MPVVDAWSAKRRASVSISRLRAWPWACLSRHPDKSDAEAPPSTQSRPASSRTTVRVLSTNISKTEGCGGAEPVGRPPGLPQRPLPNQPRFDVFLDPELPLMTPAPLDAA